VVGRMLLAVDVGNTHTVLGVFEGEVLRDHWRVATDDRRTADELRVLVAGLLGSAAFPVTVDGVAMCSTVPALVHELRDMVRRYHGDVPSVVVEPGVRTGVPVLMDNPREVGADRIVNALAAIHLFGGPCVVVDFGTATTFDVVSERGEYVGGAIAPGIEISLAALGAKGAQLRRVELARPRSVIAKNTVEALQSGAIYGFAGQVDGIVTRMAGELGRRPDQLTVIATGGLAPLVVGDCHTVDRYEPWLTLMGLRMVYERNRDG